MVKTILSLVSLFLLVSISFVFAADKTTKTSSSPSYEASSRDWVLLSDNSAGKFYAQKDPEFSNDKATTVWIKFVYSYYNRQKIIKTNGKNFSKFSYTETVYTVQCSNNSVRFDHVNWFDSNNNFIAEDALDEPKIIDNALGRALVKQYCFK